MYQGKSFLAIIPARGGSKRLPKKNIMSFGGKPLISWTINAALESLYIDKIIVSTDDPEIYSVAHEFDVDIINRPCELATDNAKTVDVIEHVLRETEQEFDYFVLLQVTSPLRTYEHINMAVEKLLNKNADSIISLTEAEHNPLWANKLPDDGVLKNFINDKVMKERSQDLAKYYRLNGAIYIVNVKKFLDYKTFFYKKSYAYVMPNEVSVDIDTRIDFICAEAILKHLSKCE